MKIITLGTTESMVLKFALAATSKDEARAVLTAVNVDDNYIISADGYRTHFAPRPENLQFENAGEPIRVLTPLRRGTNIVVYEKIHGTFPDLYSKLPNDVHNEPKATFSVNPRFIAELANMFEPGKPMTFQVCEIGGRDHIEVTGTIKNTDAIGYAMVMPMYPESKRFARPVRPTKKKPK